MYTKAPALLYKDVSMAEKTLRDLYSSEEDLIIVNGKIVYEDISKNNMNVEYYEDKIPMFHNYLIESQIDKLFSKKVWLKSGGYLIIDETEAMTVIDVNSGKAVSQESFAKTKEGCWLARHCALFGFILRYPKTKKRLPVFHLSHGISAIPELGLASSLTLTGMTLEEYYE